MTRSAGSNSPRSASRSRFARWCPLLAASLVFAVAVATAGQETIALDGRHLSIGFEVEEFWLWHVEGRFTDVEGEFALDRNEMTRSRLKVVVRTASIDTGSADRNDRLKSTEFFDVVRYPLMSFESTDIELVDQNTGVASGNLTILGTTRPIKLRFEMTAQGAARPPQTPTPIKSVRASGVLRRSDWGMTALIPAIGDEVRLNIEAVLAD